SLRVQFLASGPSPTELKDVVRERRARRGYRDCSHISDLSFRRWIRRGRFDADLLLPGDRVCADRAVSMVQASITPFATLRDSLGCITFQKEASRGYGTSRRPSGFLRCPRYPWGGGPTGTHGALPSQHGKTA